MTEDNYLPVSSHNSPEEHRTFSEFATPDTTPSYISSLSSSSVSFLVDSDDDFYESGNSSISLVTIFNKTETSFVEATVRTLLTLVAGNIPDGIKLAVCRGFKNLQLFESDSSSSDPSFPNNSFNVYHEILSRIAYRVQSNLECLSGIESRLACYAPIDNLVELTVILIHLANLCLMENIEPDFVAELPRELEKTLLFINRLLTTLSAHMNKINIDSPSAAKFPKLAYYRFIMGLFKRLVKDKGLQSITSEIVSTFCILLHDVSPKSIPIFAYQWLSIIGNSEFLHQVLNSSHAELEVLYSHHLLLLLDYLKPLTLSKELSVTPSVVEYRFGLTRLLLVIHHDFPEFFIRHGFQFIEFVPISNVQLRCIILSTVPPHIYPTNPFYAGAFIPSCLDNLELDLHAFGNSPEFDYHEWCLKESGVLGSLSKYLAGRGPMGFLLHLRDLLDENALKPSLPRLWKEPEMRAVICYAAVAHIKTLKWTWEDLPTFQTLGNSSFMDIYQILALALNEPGRALFFSLVVDRLTYPCVETYYFFMILARLFTTLRNQIVKEQLVTALMQRILANPPYQWGVLAAFTEFIQNPVFNFWSQPFLKRHPSTRLLFDTVSRTWRRPYI